MVAFSRYVEIAYEVAKQQRWYDRQMKGPGTQAKHQQFVSDLADVYNEFGHSEASESAARRFLGENVRPP